MFFSRVFFLANSLPGGQRGLLKRFFFWEEGCFNGGRRYFASCQWFTPTTSPEAGITSPRGVLMPFSVISS